MNSDQISELLGTAIKLIEIAIKYAPPSLRDDLNTAGNLLCEACGNLPDDEENVLN